MRLVVLVSCLFFLCLDGYSQTPEAKLKELGFENIELACVGDTMFVSVEDPVYRGTFRGAGVALKNLSLICPSVCFYKLVVKKENVGKIAVDASVNDGSWIVDVDYNTKEIDETIHHLERFPKDSRTYNSSVGKVNLTLYPIFSFVNNHTSKLWSLAFVLAPALEVSAWKGNKFVVQPLVPIWNNFGMQDSNPLLSKFQLGSVTVQQDFVNNAKYWCRSYAGFFHYNYVGLNVDIGVHLNKYFDLGVKANVTRWQDFNEGSLKVDDKNMYSALLTASYYEPYSSVEILLTAGRYMYGDYGCRMDGICHFGEYAIGVYGIYSGSEYNGGFHFSIPVAGKSQKRMGYFSVRMPDFFDWEYLMGSNYEWLWEQHGKSPEPLPARERSGHYWQARYIQSYLQRYLNGEVE